MSERISFGEKIKVFTQDEYKKYCIENFRKMWQWIADESLKQRRCIGKYDAIKHFGWDENIKNYCWCCEYMNKIAPDGLCSNTCPIRFDSYGILKICGENTSSYQKWRQSFIRNNYIDAAIYAAKIAELPERED